MPGGGINIDPIVDSGNTFQQFENRNTKIGKNYGVEIKRGTTTQLIISNQDLNDKRYNDNYAKVDGNVLQYFPSI